MTERLDADLRAALGQDEIEILFQPQVSVASGAIEGAEALARWQHPIHGELGAETLFAVAERSQCAVALSQHIQEKAIVAAAAWPRALSSLRLAVNITPADIACTGFAGRFLDLVSGSGFDPSHLTVEVTENEPIENLDAAATSLAILREAGIKVAIDDFGAGYSSLVYLKALPLDFLKIDKRLIEDVAESRRGRIVVRHVIAMARALALSVIAEGVETEEQRGLLGEEGCDFYQGFLCSPPVDGAALSKLTTS